MIYNEVYVGTASTADELIDILLSIKTHVPSAFAAASIIQAGGDRAPDVEVWYDKDTNTVILK